MKINKLTPRHAAPVQREINTTSSEAGTGLDTQTYGYHQTGVEWKPDPFAGDDAE